MGTDLFQEHMHCCCNRSRTPKIKPICQVVDCYETPKMYPMYLFGVHVNFQLCPDHLKELELQVGPYPKWADT